MLKIATVALLAFPALAQRIDINGLPTNFSIHDAIYSYTPGTAEIIMFLPSMQSISWVSSDIALPSGGRPAYDIALGVIEVAMIRPAGSAPCQGWLTVDHDFGPWGAPQTFTPGAVLGMPEMALADRPGGPMAAPWGGLGRTFFPTIRHTDYFGNPYPNACRQLGGIIIRCRPSIAGPFY